MQRRRHAEQPVEQHLRDAALIRVAWELARDPVHLTTKIWLDDGDVVNDFACHTRNDLVSSIVAFHGAMARLTLETSEELIGAAGGHCDDSCSGNFPYWLFVAPGWVVVPPAAPCRPAGSAGPTTSGLDWPVAG
jgi:hypothetical protein